MIKKVIFGIHTASSVGITPFTAKVVDMVVKITYNPLSPRPMPKFNPMPPRTFREESETPISVITSTEMAVENLR